MSLAGFTYLRFEDMAWTRQRVLFEVHKVKRWKANLNIASTFRLY